MIGGWSGDGQSGGITTRKEREDSSMSAHDSNVRDLALQNAV